MYFQFILLIFLTLNAPIVEDTTMKQIGFVDTTVNLKHKLGTTSIYAYGTYYYVVSAELDTTTPQLIYRLYRYDSNWANETILQSKTFAVDPDDYDILNPSCGYGYNYFATGHDFIYCYFQHNLKADPYTNTRYNFNWDIDLGTLADFLGSPWESTTSTGGQEYASQEIRSNLYSGTTYRPSGSYFTNTHHATNPSTLTFASASAYESIAAPSSGVFVEQLDPTIIIRYVIYSGGNLLLREYNDGVISTLETIATGAGATLSHISAYYWEEGNIKILTYEDNFYYNQDSTWKRIDTDLSAVPIPIWSMDGDTTILKGFIFGDFYIRIPTNEHYIEIYRHYSTATIISAWYPYVIDSNNNILTISTATTTNITTAANKEVLGRASPTIPIFTTYEPVTTQWVEIYDDTPVLEIKGIIVKYDYDFEKYICIVEKPSDYDLDTAIDYDPTTLHAEAIIKDIIDTKCTYLTYDSSITDPDSDKTYAKWNNTTIRKIFTEIAKTEGYIWTVHPNFDVYFNQGRASGVTINDTVDGIRFTSKNPVKKIPQPRSHIILEGKWNATSGKRDTVESFADPSAALYFDQFPNADATQLASILTGLTNLVNLTYIQVKDIKCYNKTLRVGDSFALTLTKYSITADTYYVIEITKDLIHNELYFSCTSALIIPKTDQTAATEERIVSAEENIDATNVRVDTKVTLTGTETIAGVKTFNDGLKLANNKALTARNTADTADLECLKLNNYDYLLLGTGTNVQGVQFDKHVYMGQNKALYWLNAALDTQLECIKLDTSNYLDIAKDADAVRIYKPLYHRSYTYILNNYGIHYLNAAGNAWLECLKLDPSDILQIGAGAASLCQNKTMLPSGNKTLDLGSAGTAYDTIYADDFQNVASETKSRYIEPTQALDAIKAIRKCKDSEQPDYASMAFAQPFTKPILNEKNEVVAVELHHKRSLVANLDYLNSANQALEQRIATLELTLIEIVEKLNKIIEVINK